VSGGVPPLPQYVFMEWCFVKHRDNFTLTFLVGWKTLNVQNNSLTVDLSEDDLDDR